MKVLLINAHHPLFNAPSIKRPPHDGKSLINTQGCHKDPATFLHEKSWEIMRILAKSMRIMTKIRRFCTSLWIRSETLGWFLLGAFSECLSLSPLACFPVILRLIATDRFQTNAKCKYKMSWCHFYHDC